MTHPPLPSGGIDESVYKIKDFTLSTGLCITLTSFGIYHDVKVYSL